MEKKLLTVFGLEKVIQAFPSDKQHLLIALTLSSSGLYSTVGVVERAYVGIVIRPGLGFQFQSLSAYKTQAKLLEPQFPHLKYRLVIVIQFTGLL